MDAAANPVNEREEACSPATLPSERADLRVLAAVRTIVRSVHHYSRQLARTNGISVTQLVCLETLRNGGPLTLKGLAERLRMAPSSLVAVVDRLVDAELTSRERSQTDRRKLVLAVTPKGVTLLAESPTLLDDLLAHRLNQLPEAERLTMASALERVVTLMPAASPAHPTLPIGFEPGPVTEPDTTTIPG